MADDGLSNGVNGGGKNFDCAHGSELYPATVVERRPIYPRWKVMPIAASLSAQASTFERGMSCEGADREALAMSATVHCKGACDVSSPDHKTETGNGAPTSIVAHAPTARHVKGMSALDREPALKPTSRPPLPLRSPPA